MYDKIALLRLRIARLEKLADLSPGLGTQKNPCYVLERAKNNPRVKIDDLNWVKSKLDELEIKTIDGVSALEDVAVEDRRRFYRMTYPGGMLWEMTNEKPIGKKKRRRAPFIKKFELLQHTQFRMDLRSIEVKQIDDALRTFQLKKDSEEIMEAALQEPADRFGAHGVIVHKHGSMVLVFRPYSMDSVSITSVYFKGKSDPTLDNC